MLEFLTQVIYPLTTLGVGVFIGYNIKGAKDAIDKEDRKQIKEELG